jgi:hypothetical protein
MIRVLALAGQSKIRCITQRRFAKAGTKTHPQRGAALDRNGLSVSTETACRFEPKSPVGNSEICHGQRGRCFGQPAASMRDFCSGAYTTSRARRSVACEGTARRARGPPVRYRDKPAPTPERDPLHADRQATEKKRTRVEKILLPPAVRLKNEKRPFRSEQKTGNKPNNHLTEKLPYKSASSRSPLERLCAKIGLFQSSRRVFVQASIPARKPIVGESNHALSRKWGFVAVYAIAYACMLVAMGYAVWTLI